MSKSSKKSKTIKGTRFQCTLCSGKGSYFIATQRDGESNKGAMDRLRERVKQHWGDTGHAMILPVNPPKGFHYVDASSKQQVGPKYDGKDLGAWLTQVKSMLRNTNSEPSWEL